jgi:bifunctional DNase/RNase
MFIEMKLKSLAFDPASNGFAVLLCDLEDTQTLPIRIEPLEANLIALKAKKVQVYRPMTHDLIRNILKMFKAEIVKIEVTDIRDHTYYTLIHLRANGKELTLDARPSDAIALAVAESIPIYVAEEVLAKAKTIELDRLEGWLESLDPEDFKYTA